jgi:glycosyltransferase involved in cell wall biosynthesis
MSGPIRHVGIVVPVANEEDLLGRCLQALQVTRTVAATRRPDVGPIRIVLALDCCTDASAAIAARHVGVETVAVDVRAVGPARALGVAHLLGTGPRGSAQHTWIANTDADSEVSPGWLAGMLDEAARGAQVVLGTVRPDHGLPPDVDAAWQQRHHRRDDHPHVHGANFGIRADAYLALGGWPLVPTGEDQALADRARAAGNLHIVRTGRLPVRTSSRLDGRALLGFSSYLRALGTADEGAA